MYKETKRLMHEEKNPHHSAHKGQINFSNKL